MIDASERWNDGEEDPLFSEDHETLAAYLTPTPVDDPHYRCEGCQRMIDDPTQEYWYVNPQEECHLVCESCAEAYDKEERTLPGMPPFMSPQHFIARLAGFIRVVSQGQPDPAQVAHAAKRVLIPSRDLPTVMTFRRTDVSPFVSVRKLCDEWIPAVCGGSMIDESYELNRLELIDDCARALSRSLGEAITRHVALNRVPASPLDEELEPDWTPPFDSAEYLDWYAETYGQAPDDDPDQDGARSISDDHRDGEPHGDAGA